MRAPQLIALLAGILSFYSLTAQTTRPKIKYGDVSEKDFEPKVYSVDSSADAVYLYDVGESYFGESTVSFDVIYRKHARIRILKKTGFDIATVEIPLYRWGSDQQFISHLDATTYNIENGKVVTTSVDKNSMFKDKGDNYTLIKFTFPNLKEGSIIEFKYEISSPTPEHIRGWNFQSKNYPKLWSEYSVSIPDFLDFVMIPSGYLPYTVDSVSMSVMSFARGKLPANILKHKWAIKDVPVLKKEEFITTLDNYLSNIEFQLSMIRFPNQPVQTIMQNWPDFAQDLMKDEDFSEALNHQNNWLDDDIKKITANAKNDEEKAKKIFEFVRDNFTCVDHEAHYLSQSLKKTFQDKKGNVVDINMLLAVMLKNIDFETHPVLLSTRDNGYASETYPIMSKFNYVITQAIKGDKKYLLDASNPNNGFNCLPTECYNGTGRVIADMPVLVDLSADSLTETKMTTVFMMNDEKGVTGAFSTTLGNEESQTIRKRMKSTTSEDFFKEIKKSYSMDLEMSNTEIDSLKMPEEPVAIKYEIKFSPGDDDIFYFSPMLAEAYKENPFKAAERLYPVEMPACTNETYILSMEVPKGYKVEELPKSARVMLNEDEGMFEYIIGMSGDHIQLRCRTLIKKANFLPEDYATLRDFFTYVVKKEAEQIVFKKL